MTSAPGLLEKSQILIDLQEGDLDIKGQFTFGSNFTFLGEITQPDRQFSVVYKPGRGERPLWDFPAKSLAKRETAAFLVSESLGWDLVPPTVFRKKGPLGSGSVQLYIQHNPDIHYFTFENADKQRLRPVALFDILINNADRKGGHILCDPLDHLWLIDHGICFHVDDKLRTVLWDFAGEEIPRTLLVDIENFSEDLKSGKATLQAIKPLLRKYEINALITRAENILQKPIFPNPGKGMYYPWPPL